jgi:Tol biopolymer transport system component
MTRDPDLIGLIEGYLDDFEGDTPLPDATRDAIRTRLPSTTQRPAWWPRWRSLEINTLMKYALGAAAVVVIAFYGVQILSPAGAVGGRPEGARLVYQLGGDIYLANADGTGSTLVADDGYLSPGNVWSPDGRYFLYQSSGELRLGDADGRMVSSFPARFGAMFSDHSAWSPDSTRIQGWSPGRAGIEIYSIDGDLEASLSLPDGYSRLWDVGAHWAPDGRSLFAYLRGADAVGEVWELPVDGSAPRRVAPDHAFASQSVTFAPDGRHVAYIRDAGTPEAPAAQLFVANGDGSDARLVVEPGRYPAFPEWSPSGDRLGYFVSKGNAVDLVVLDLASGVIQTAIADYSRDGYPPFSWSPTGDVILFAAPGPGGGPSLWTVNVDGTERAVLVEGSVWGELQPVDPNL